jgi:hypothetical protein
MSEKDGAKNLKPLTRVLIFKIAFTALFWCIPLLFFPPALFVNLGMEEPRPLVFVRLLGAAYLALLVGYSFGLAETRKGRMPTGVVWTGAVSNGLASAILFYHGLVTGWVPWARLAPAFMWISAVVTLLITVGLLYYGRPWKRARTHGTQS